MYKMIKILSIGETYIKNGIHKRNNVSYIGGITHDPMETFNYIIHHRPDIIVYATELGNLENLTVYHRIRNMYAGKYIPIILFVHEEDEELYEDLYEDGITIGLHPDVQEELLFLHVQQLVDRCKQRKKNILIVDKDKVILNTYRLFLEGKYQIHTSGSTQEAINYLMSETLHAIIISISEKDNVGLNFLQILQGNPLWKEIPIITQISDNSTKLVAEILANGATDCLIKPVGRETLLERLSYALSEKKPPIKVSEMRMKRILVIDKLGISCKSIKNTLNGHYESIHLLPGVRAVSILEIEQIDGIILNFDNGYFCLNKIMEKAFAKHIPIILYTANMKEIEKSLDENTKGATCITSILELPVNREILLERLEIAI